MRTLIVGAGPTGLALALYLERAGLPYDIVEQRPGESAGGGYGLEFWSHGREVLTELGVAAGFDAAANRLETFRIERGSGRQIATFRTANAYGPRGLAFFSVERAKLTESMGAALPPGTVRYGVALGRATDDGAGVDVTFGDGAQARYGLVVGCDGSNSSLRRATFPESTERDLGLRVWYAPIDPSRVPAQTALNAVATGRYVFASRAGETAFIFLCAAGARRESTPPEDPRATFARVSLAARLLANVPAETIRPVNAVEVARPCFCRGRIVLAGDAAHGAEAWAGLGATLGLSDARALASIIVAGATEEGLERYARSRAKVARAARRLSNGIGRWALARNPVTRQILDLGTPLFGRTLSAAGYAALFALASEVA